jgi:hypothetical protein
MKRFEIGENLSTALQAIAFFAMIAIGIATCNCH